MKYIVWLIVIFSFLSCNLETINKDKVISKTDEFKKLIIYQVMVGTFNDGDSTRNYNVGYGPGKHAGDIKGITDALPYIASLGVNALWLTPIFDSDAGTGNDARLDATGYFCRDYFKIDPNFGTFDDAKEMVEKAHELGLYVFFDGVFGHHKGEVHPSPSGKVPIGDPSQVDYPESLEFYKEVAVYWIDKLGIDGWRLDQAFQVPLESWVEIRKAVEQICDERKKNGHKWGTLGYMVGEVWNGEIEISQTTYGNDSLKALYSAFDFPMRYRIVQALAVEENGLGKKPATILNDGYNTHKVYPKHAIPNLMITNHDLVRFGDLIQRAGYGGKENPDYWLRHKAAFSFMASYSGPITIYYNDEIGFELPGYAMQLNRTTDSCVAKNLCDDHVSRTTGKIKGFDNNEIDLLNYLRNLLEIRKASPALYMGIREHIYSDNNFYVDLKSYEQTRVLYVLNISLEDRYYELKKSDIKASELVAVLDNSPIEDKDSIFSIYSKRLTGNFFLIK